METTTLYTNNESEAVEDSRDFVVSLFWAFGNKFKNSYGKIFDNPEGWDLVRFKEEVEKGLNFTYSHVWEDDDIPAPSPIKILMLQHFNEHQDLYELFNYPDYIEIGIQHLEEILMGLDLKPWEDFVISLFGVFGTKNISEGQVTFERPDGWDIEKFSNEMTEALKRVQLHIYGDCELPEPTPFQALVIQHYETNSELYEPSTFDNYMNEGLERLRLLI